MRDKDRHKESVRRYQAAHPEVLRATHKRYREANRKKVSAATARYAAAHPEKVSMYNRTARLTRYGLTREDYDVMAARQDHACAICGAESWMEPGGILHIDHDHKAGDVRGLLCSRCNRGLGNFRDDPELLAEAIRYLEDYYGVL